MANSRYEYTRTFEQPDTLLPNTYIVIRIDGRGFHRLSAARAFAKPNDERALRLANQAAAAVLRDLPDVVIAYGQSDEFSFIFPPSSTLFERRAAKLVSTVVSTFTAYYVLFWPALFPECPLVRPVSGSGSAEDAKGETDAGEGLDVEAEDGVQATLDSSLEKTGPIPTFDGRAVVYPTARNLRDYLSWRQADCHINNLYNTTFWALVQQGGLSARDAEQRLMGTVSGDKNEILFSQFGVNYNNEPAMFRKGTVIYRDYTDEPAAESQHAGHKKPDPNSRSQRDRERKRRAKAKVVIEHVDIIEDGFWERRPWLLET